MTPTKPAKRLSSLKSVRTEMEHVYRDMRDGRIPPGDGTKLVYALSAIQSAIESETVEKRLIELERRTAR